VESDGLLIFFPPFMATQIAGDAEAKRLAHELDLTASVERCRRVAALAETARLTYEQLTAQ